MSQRCIQAFVSGRVQGVFFRESTRREAIRFNISGHAINLSDGRVEVLACGESSSIDELIEWLHQGPPYASVNGVDVRELPGQHPTSRFVTG